MPAFFMFVALIVVGVWIAGVISYKVFREAIKKATKEIKEAVKDEIVCDILSDLQKSESEEIK